MTKTLGYKKVCVVQDNSDYGVGLAEVVTSTPRAPPPTPTAQPRSRSGDKDFSATVQLVKGESPDAVFYAGYYAEAAPFVQQLRDGGVTATFVSADGTNDPQFVAQAGACLQGRDPVLPVWPGTGRLRDRVHRTSTARPRVCTRPRVTT